MQEFVERVNAMRISQRHLVSHPERDDAVTAARTLERIVDEAVVEYISETVTDDEIEPDDGVVVDDYFDEEELA